MQHIVNALHDLWSQIESVIGSDVLNTILAVSLIFFVYFLFIRLFLSLIKSSENVKLMCDIMVVLICGLVVIGNLLPTFKVDKVVRNDNYYHDYPVSTDSSQGGSVPPVVSVNVFGVMWDPTNTSTELTRLTRATDPYHYVTVDISTEPSPATGIGSGSSPFDSFAPWKDMDEYNIINGVVSYERGDEGFSRTSYDTVVFIPEFYFKTVYDSENNKWYFYIAGGALTGFEKHPGSGSYVGKYNTISGHYSKSGSVPLTNSDRPTFRSGATSKGEKWCLYDVASWMAIQYLYLVEFADWNSQAKIGTGIVSTGSKSNTGLTDTMVYHTGQISSGSAVMYRWIENPWGNVWDNCDGFNANNRAVYICTDPSKYADTITSDYVSAGVTLPSSNGYIKSLGFSSAFPWAFLPDTIGGSETSYIPDYVYSNSGLRVLYAGGSCSGDLKAGLFDLYAFGAASYADDSVGARLRFIP